MTDSKRLAAANSPTTLSGVTIAAEVDGQPDYGAVFNLLGMEAAEAVKASKRKKAQHSILADVLRIVKLRLVLRRMKREYHGYRFAVDSTHHQVPSDTHGVTCGTCGKTFHPSQLTVMPVTALIRSGLYCPDCYEHRWDNA